MITPYFAAILAIFYIFLAVLIQAYRFRNRVPNGDASGALTARIRAHGNFIEYTPIALILAYFIEINGGDREFLKVLLILFSFGRILHASALLYFEPVKRQFLPRIIAMLLNHVTIVIMAATILTSGN